MTEAEKKYLFDIKTSIELIESFLGEINSFPEYDYDLKTRSAVERHFAIIGEAVSKLLQLSPTVQLSNAKQIVDFRNRLIHAYDVVDSTIVWAIINDDLPLLKQEVLELLKIGS